MQIERKNIKELSYLAGFHLLNPDYNYKGISGKLFNFINDITKRNFDPLNIDDEIIILKDQTEPLFEVKFTKSSLIYEDLANDFESFKKTAFDILDYWQSISSKSHNLKIAGIRFLTQIELETPKGVYNSRIVDEYLKNLKIDGKKKKLSLHINYLKSLQGKEYNININIDELLLKKYILEFKLDINQINDNGSNKIDRNRAIEIFDFARNYYYKDFWNDINIQVNEI